MFIDKSETSFESELFDNADGGEKYDSRRWECEEYYRKKCEECVNYFRNKSRKCRNVECREYYEK